MTEDFAVLDFALVDVPPLAVAEALERARQGGFQPSPEAEATEPEEERKTGILFKIFGREAPPPQPEPEVRVHVPPLMVQRTDSLPEAPITRLVQADMGFGAQEDPVRLSAPAGGLGLTLIEFRNHHEVALSEMLKSLSAKLPGSELFGFRYSGQRHDGADYAFAVYREGELLRMRSSRSPAGISDDADWKGIDHGRPHKLEATLPRANTRLPDTILTPEMQYDILQALKIEPDDLFDPTIPYAQRLVLSVEPSGVPLETAIQRAVAGEDIHAITDIPSDSPKVASPSAAAVPAPQSFQADETLAAHLSGPGPETVDDWEGEITGLLVDAVEDSLPPDQHVPWLNTLTDQLESGDIEGAISKARALINQGTRPVEERRAAADRLAALFSTHHG